MTTKPAFYAGLIACAALILIKGADGNMMEGIGLGLATLLGTVIYARSVGRNLD
jgi:hypothetical protein